MNNINIAYCLNKLTGSPNLSAGSNYRFGNDYSYISRNLKESPDDTFEELQSRYQHEQINNAPHVVDISRVVPKYAYNLELAKRDETNIKILSSFANSTESAKIKKKPGPFLCTYCNKTFTQKGNLQTHQRLHTGDRPYICKLCPEKFHQLSNLRRHIRHHTSSNFECPICLKHLGSEEKLKEHSPLHNNEKLQCKVCDKVFRHLGHFVKHRKLCK